MASKPLPAVKTPVPDSCGSCFFFLRKDETYGLCRKRVLSTVDPNRLTPFGPLGTFAVMSKDQWCGEFKVRS